MQRACEDPSLAVYFDDNQFRSFLDFEDALGALFHFTLVAVFSCAPRLGPLVSSAIWGKRYAPDLTFTARVS